MVQNRKESS